MAFWACENSLYSFRIDPALFTAWRAASTAIVIVSSSVSGTIFHRPLILLLYCLRYHPILWISLRPLSCNVDVSTIWYNSNTHFLPQFPFLIIIKSMLDIVWFQRMDQFVHGHYGCNQWYAFYLSYLYCDRSIWVAGSPCMTIRAGFKFVTLSATMGDLPVETLWIS